VTEVEEGGAKSSTGTSARRRSLSQIFNSFSSESETANNDGDQAVLGTITLVNDSSSDQQGIEGDNDLGNTSSSHSREKKRSATTTAAVQQQQDERVIRRGSSSLRIINAPLSIITGGAETRLPFTPRSPPAAATSPSSTAIVTAAASANGGAATSAATEMDDFFADIPHIKGFDDDYDFDGDGNKNKTSSPFRAVAEGRDRDQALVKNLNMGKESPKQRNKKRQESIGTDGDRDHGLNKVGSGARVGSVGSIGGMGATATGAGIGAAAGSDDDDDEEDDKEDKGSRSGSDRSMASTAVSYGGMDATTELAVGLVDYALIIGENKQSRV
jgi:hypothetical protein